MHISLIRVAKSITAFTSVRAGAHEAQVLLAMATEHAQAHGWKGTETQPPSAGTAGYHSGSFSSLQGVEGAPLLLEESVLAVLDLLQQRTQVLWRLGQSVSKLNITISPGMAI